MKRLNRSDLIETALELNKAGAAIRNPRFQKTAALEQAIRDADIEDWEGLSIQAVEALRALGRRDIPSNAAAPSAKRAKERLRASREPLKECVRKLSKERSKEPSEPPKELNEPPKEPRRMPLDADALPKDLTSREALEIAALEMNEVMGLEPGIDVSLVDVAFLRAFRKAAGMAAGTDEFSDYTWAVLQANDLGPERVLPEPPDVIVRKAVRNAKPAEADLPAASEPVKAASSVASVKLKPATAESVAAEAEPEPAPAKSKKEKAASSATEGKRANAMRPTPDVSDAHPAPLAAPPVEKAIGVAACIRNFVRGKFQARKEFTKDELLGVLSAMFPEKPEHSLWNTLSTQLSTPMRRAGYQLERLDAARFKVVAVPE